MCVGRSWKRLDGEELDAEHLIDDSLLDRELAELGEDRDDVSVIVVDDGISLRGTALRFLNSLELDHQEVRVQIKPDGLGNGRDLEGKCSGLEKNGLNVGGRLRQDDLDLEIRALHVLPIGKQRFEHLAPLARRSLSQGANRHRALGTLVKNEVVSQCLGDEGEDTAKPACQQKPPYGKTPPHRGHEPHGHADEQAAEENARVHDVATVVLALRDQGRIDADLAVLVGSQSEEAAPEADRIPRGFRDHRKRRDVVLLESALDAHAVTTALCRPFLTRLHALLDRLVSQPRIVDSESGHSDATTLPSQHLQTGRNSRTLERLLHSMIDILQTGSCHVVSFPSHCEKHTLSQRTVLK